MCMIKFKLAFCLGLHVILIHLQPEIIIILFEELGYKSNPVLGKLRFFEMLHKNSSTSQSCANSSVQVHRSTVPTVVFKNIAVLCQK
jgi:hypothetical protein